MADTQNNSDFLTSNTSDNIDIGKLLQKLIGNNQSQMQQDSADAEKVHQELMANVAKKTLTNNLQQHADNLMASNPDAINILSTAIAAHQANQQQSSTISKQTNADSTPTQTLTPIQQQAMDIVSPATTPIGKLFQSLGIGDTTKRYKLDNLAKAQRVIAGQPSDIALPQAQAEQAQALKEQVQQQIKGLTPAQQAEAIGNYNSALINQHNELQKGITDQITSTATTIDQLVKNTPLLDKSPGSPYYDTLKQLQARLQGLTNQGKDAIGKLKDLQLTNPNLKSENNGIQQFKVGGVTYNIPANKVAAFKKAKGL